MVTCTQNSSDSLSVHMKYILFSMEGIPSIRVNLLYSAVRVLWAVLYMIALNDAESNIQGPPTFCSFEDRRTHNQLVKMYKNMNIAFENTVNLYTE